VIAIRAARPADADAIAAIYAPHAETGDATFEEVAPDAAEMARRMTTGLGWLVAEAEDGVVGYAYASPFHPRAGYRWTVETSVYVAAAAYGAGVGKRLYAALIAELRARGYAQAVARIALPGEASLALHRSLGFEPVGVQRAVGWKNGRWIDVALWQRALADLPAPPPQPRAR
jgi:phosphinothricin acetyltransferase